MTDPVVVCIPEQLTGARIEDDESGRCTHLHLQAAKGEELVLTIPDNSAQFLQRALDRVAQAYVPERKT